MGLDWIGMGLDGMGMGCCKRIVQPSPAAVDGEQVRIHVDLTGLDQHTFSQHRPPRLRTVSISIRAPSRHRSISTPPHKPTVILGNACRK